MKIIPSRKDRVIRPSFFMDQVMQAILYMELTTTRDMKLIESTPARDSKHGGGYFI